MNKYHHTVLTDGDLTIIIQNTFHRPKGKTDGPHSEEVWHVIMASPHFESGIYRKEVVDCHEDGLEMAWDQFYEEYAHEVPRNELKNIVSRTDHQ